MTHYVLPATPPAARLIRAIDAVRCPDGTELYERVEGGVVVSSERRPARPWAEPIPLRDGTFAVPMPDRKAATVLRDLPPTREVDVRERPDATPVRVRVPRLDERVAVRDEDRADVEPDADPRGPGRDDSGATPRTRTT
jgi:hypothetical protein